MRRQSLFHILFIVCFSFSSQLSQIDPDNQAIYLCLEFPRDNDRYILQNVIIPTINSLSSQCTNPYLYKELKNIKDKISSNLNGYFNFIDEYSYPDSFHVTTYYRGDGKWDFTNKAVNEFNENEEVAVTIKAIGIIPSGIITASVETTAFSNNQYKHITLLLGDMTAYESNLFLRDIFSNGKYLNWDYLNNFEKNKGKAYFFNDTINNKQRDVMFYILDKPLTLTMFRKANK